MTTTDLIYEALRNFRESLMTEIRKIVRAEVKAALRSKAYAKTP